MKEQPKQYRSLEVGEIIQEGDEFAVSLNDWTKTNLAGSMVPGRHCGSYRREIKPEPSANGWQSMDTAPKDGTEISVWTQRGRYDVAKWDSQKYNKNPKPYWDRWNGFGVIWRESGRDGDSCPE